MLELPRADDLRLLRDICHFLHLQEYEQSSAHSLCHWLASCARGSFAREWKKSRIYHYTSAAQALDLMQKLDNHHFGLTDAGHELVECRDDTPDPETVLSSGEQRILMSCIFHSQSTQRYLSFYMPSALPPQSPAAFAREAKPIKIVRRDQRAFALTTASGEVIEITPAEKKSYAWTLFNWLKTLTLVDDIYSEHPASFILKDVECRVFYPVRTAMLNVEDMKDILLKKARASKQRIVFYYIPELLLDICTTHGIAKRAFQDALLRLHKQEPVRFYLLMMSRLRSDDRCSRHYSYDNFPRVNGVMRSHICIRMDVDQEHIL